MRSNPLDNTREFDPHRLLIFAGAMVVMLLGAGVAADRITEARRMGFVRDAVDARGYGRATVTPIPGGECWRAAEGFRWRTATAEGTACAGPRDHVVIRKG